MKETHPRQRMEDTRPPNYQTYSWLSGHVSIDTRGIAARLLISEGYESNPQIDGFFRDLNHGNANNAEDHGDSQIAQRPGNYLSSCDAHCCCCMGGMEGRKW